MSALLEQAFGASDVNLYEDVLKVPKDCSLSQLRKAYYQQALKYHPDKNPGDDAKRKFQAISWAYQLLKDPEKRADYDNDGVIPHDDDIDDNDEEKGPNAWKEYFDLIFGKLSTDDIDQFAMKYKMSEDEEKDVLKHYEQFKGNLVKMLEYVMLSEERDVKRWVEDYIQPAIDDGKVKNYSDALKKTLQKVQKKMEKERKETQQQHDTDETETEGSEEGDKEEPTKKTARKKKEPPRKAKPTKGKKKKSSEQDLIAAIRNKKGGNPFSALGARYGVSMDDDDPLDDAAFAKLNAKYKRK
jgi:DnaJ family protein C protein 9